MNIIAPKLQQGDEVRVIAPSSSLKIIDEDNVKLAIKAIEALGLKVSFGKYVNELDRMGSSSIASRVEDIHEAFKDTKVKAILSVIGGTNVNQLLAYLDFDLIQSNPKILCGFSDITALQNAIYAKTGLITYSGPHFSTFAMKKGFEYSLQYFNKMLFHPEKVNIEAAKEWADDAWFLKQENRTFKPNEGYWIFHEGVAKGTIVGGNLCTFQLLHGTPFMPSLKDTILFIEADSIARDDIDALEFDRDLQSLIHQPHFKAVKGMVIGRFESKFNMDKEKLQYIIETKKELKNIPIIANVDFGHTNPMFTFPIGGCCEIELSKNAASIILSENAHN